MPEQRPAHDDSAGSSPGLAEQLRSAEWKLQTILETAIDGIVVIDERGCIETANRAAERLFGFEPGGLLGKNVSVLMPSPVSEEHDGYIKRYLETGDAHIIGLGREVIGQRLDGSRFPLHLCVGEIRKGQTRRFTGILHDLSAYKALERDLVRSQQLEAVGRLAGGIAHEFNNLLMAIMSCADRAAHKLPEDSPAKKYLVEIPRAGERASRLIRQLLDYSRDKPPQRRPTDMNQLVGGLQKMLGQLLGADVEFRVELQASSDTTYCDPARIEQVLLNLVLNARDALSDGGSLCVRTSDCQLARNHGRPDLVPGAYTMLEVSDDGCGMQPATIEHAFEPFFTTKGSEKGSGLGLAVVHAIVSQHGGSIDVDSRPGAGTSIRIMLPRFEPHNQPPATRP